MEARPAVMYRLETPEAELKMFLSGMDGIRNERVQRREAGMELSGRKRRAWMKEDMQRRMLG